MNKKDINHVQNKFEHFFVPSLGLISFSACKSTTFFTDILSKASSDPRVLYFALKSS